MQICVYKDVGSHCANPLDENNYLWKINKMKKMKSIKKRHLTVLMIAITIFCNSYKTKAQNLTAFETNGKWGYKNKTGKIIVAPKFQEVQEEYSEGFTAVKLNGKWGFIDSTGKAITTFIYDEAFGFFNGYGRVSMNEKSGLINKLGKEITGFKYSSARGVGDGFAAVQLNEESEEYELIDKTGKIITRIQYKGIDTYLSEGLILVWNHSKCGFINTSGATVIPLAYDVANSFSDGLATVNKGATGINPWDREGGKWGAIDKTGKEIIPLIYDKLYKFYNGKAEATLNGKSFYIDKTGKEVPK